MLLKLLYDFAHSRRLLDDTAFSPKRVRWIIALDSDGNLLGHGPRATGDDQKGKEFSCPFTTRNKNKGGISEFLADGLAAVFGLDLEPDAPLPPAKRVARDENNRNKHKDFWRQFEEALAMHSLAELRAVLQFRQPPGVVPTFLRWGTSASGPELRKSAWWLRTAAGVEVKLRAENFSFEVDGKLLVDHESLRAYWRQQHAGEIDRASDSSRRGLCLVTGQEDVTLANTHDPAIKGVGDAQPSGAKIVSFEKSAPAFSSYGHEQSLNAPTSRAAAAAYCTALNWLLRNDDHRLSIGRTTVCFWTREQDTPSNFFASLLTRPDPLALRRFLTQPWSGFPRESTQPDQFYAVTLSGNSGRIVVKHWVQVPLTSAMENFRKWFGDLDIDAPSRSAVASRKASSMPPPLALAQLALATVADEKGLYPDISSQLFRAAVEATAPSVTLLKPILDRLRSNLVRKERYNVLFDHSRFALLKLVVNRNRKETHMEILPTLTVQTADPAYNSGRLLAVLSAAQSKAHEYKLEGPGVAGRYFGTASVSPSSVLPLLLRLNRHHLAKIAKSERYHGHERFLEVQLQEILTLFKPGTPGRSPEFPRSLDLQAQGRFALGFYQQQAADYAARNADRVAGSPAIAPSLD